MKLRTELIRWRAKGAIGVNRLQSHSLSDDLPAGIGPHEGRELELMLAGRKLLATFCDVVPASYEIPEAAFAPHVASGAIVRREEIYRRPKAEFATRFVYYALPHETWRIDAMHMLNNALYAGLQTATERDEIEIGRLLGYSEAEIRVYLAWTREERIKAGQKVE